MLLNEIKPSKGARKARKRVGRGNASGKGTFSGRGCKGQNARSGGGVRIGFEGGQTPLYKRLPKLKGFTNRSRVEYQVVNLSDLEKIKETKITKELLLKLGLVSKKDMRVKLLATGEITKSLEVNLDKVSVSAKAKIEKAGGKIIENTTK